MSRYQLARAVDGSRGYEAAVREDSVLLRMFGLTLLSVDCGVSAAVDREVRNGRIHPWNVVRLDDKTWNWLRPLLIRLAAQEKEGKD